MQSITQDSKFDYKSIPIQQVIHRAGLSLHQSGRYYLCRCPFHRDDTPSMVIYPSSNSWACFGKCQSKNGHRNGGDVIEFLKQYYTFTFSESVAWLKQNFTYFEPVIIEKKEPEPTKPVPHPWVLYWHSLLQEHRQYFYSRGFTDEFIDRELWGWTGKRYTLPVWEGEPSNSDILGVRQRKPDNQKEGSAKYVGLKGYNTSGVIWGKWHCRNSKTIVATAGEFDAAMFVQLGIPAISIVNGINSVVMLPNEWPNWFENSNYLISVFDRKEESFGGQLCSQWNKIKGPMKGKIFSWPINISCKDFCEFVSIYQEKSKKEFFKLLVLQNLNYEL